MKYKLGDKVWLRDDLESRFYGSKVWVDDMLKGCKVTIKEEGFGYYVLKEDEDMYSYTDEMIEGYAYERGDKVQNIHNNDKSISSKF